MSLKLLSLLLLQAVMASKKKIPESEAIEIHPPDPTAVCLLQSSTGSCGVPVWRWYYNLTEGECKRFTYKGCKGNGNRFRSQQKCEQVCALPEVPLDDKPACEQPLEPGPCKASVKRWYYAHQNGSCLPFLYGGCRGNSNNFESQLECEYMCSKSQQTPFDPCTQPQAIGTCNGKIPRWYFDIDDRKCKFFRYSGCGGNSNNFMSKHECEGTCLNALKLYGACGQPSAYGDCGIRIRRWFFNPKHRQCEKFVWSGCGGNSNNFESKRRCETHCLREITCNQNMDKGSCRSFSEKWYFNRDSKRCERFVYGGCGGNLNRFDTESKCVRKCLRQDDDK